MHGKKERGGFNQNADISGGVAHMGLMNPHSARTDVSEQVL